MKNKSRNGIGVATERNQWHFLIHFSFDESIWSLRREEDAVEDKEYPFTIASTFMSYE